MNIASSNRLNPDVGETRRYWSRVFDLATETYYFRVAEEVRVLNFKVV